MSKLNSLELPGDESIFTGVMPPHFVATEMSLEEDLSLPTKKEVAQIMQEVAEIVESSGG